MRISLGSLPSERREYTVKLPKLSGGLNLRELDYRLGEDESPDMKNLWWKDGVLQCRDGQVKIYDQWTETGYACYDRLFYGGVFVHIGRFIHHLRLNGGGMEWVKTMARVPENPGVFFRYGGALYYKNRGGFLRIDLVGSGAWSLAARDLSQRDLGVAAGQFRATDLTDGANVYIPVTVINAAPENGAGDLYQPENRLGTRKTIWYNAKEGVTKYYLPEQDIDRVWQVTVDGQVMTAGVDYWVAPYEGYVDFAQAPAVSDPAVNNTVRVTYSKENTAAREALLTCDKAAASPDGLCMLLSGGSTANAVFWNGNDSAGMNAAYFPMDCYNLCGDAGDPVTGFAKQYGDLILLKERSVGRLDYTTETVEGRDTPGFLYRSINPGIGCDLPGSIALVENNVVFCNARLGVFMLTAASAAYENNVRCVSGKVNGGESRGLLADVHKEKDAVTAVDDGERYWLCANGRCYVWDYRNTSPEDPSWYFFEGVKPAAFFMDDAGKLYHLNRAGEVTRFERCFTDYDQAIEKSYTTPTLTFGSYQRRKDVTGLLLAVRSDTDSTVTIRYDTDHEQRFDLTPIQERGWRLSPRNLARRCLQVERFARVARRDPGCRHIRHFSMTLSNCQPQEDLAIVSAQIFYKFTGKER